MKKSSEKHYPQTQTDSGDNILAPFQCIRDLEFLS